MPLVDPWGDVFIPLKDSYAVGGGGSGTTFLFGEHHYVPRVYLTRGEQARQFISEPDENQSQFERSLQKALNKGSAERCHVLGNCTYPPHVNFNSFFADVNGDGLPDLISAVAPTRPASTPQGEQNRLVCGMGHRVQLNRGYTFEDAPSETLAVQTWTNVADLTHPLTRLANRDRLCDSPRPRICDGVMGATVNFTCAAPTADKPTFPTAAMAQTDINGDGRVDIVLAYRPNGVESDTKQEVYLNTGRGYQAASPMNFGLPPGVALSHNIPYPDEGQTPSTIGWPRVGLGDMARFVDLDNDGLVDIVTGGLCSRPEVNVTHCTPASWYRNEGDLPDRMVRVEGSDGAWTEVEYETPKAEILQLASGGIHPANSMRVVKSIRSAAGPVPTPTGYDPFPVQEVRLSYDNYVRDPLSNEVLGFEKVIAEFVNAFDGVQRETVKVTRRFDVQPEILDTAGVVLPVRHPLKGAPVSTITESDGWIATELIEYAVEPLGTGVRIRPRRELHGDVSPSQAAAWTAEETVSFDLFGNPTERVTGNWDGAAVGPPEQRRTTGTAYEDDRTDSRWMIGLVTRQQSLGYSEDIDGNVDTAHVLGETRTTYNATGDVETTTRVNIRAPLCEGADDDVTTYSYRPTGLLKRSVEAAGPGAVHFRVVDFAYDAKNLYVASATTSVGAMSAGVFVPASTTLTATFLTDLRHGKTTKSTDANGKSTTSTYDSSGRLLTRTGPDNTVLETNVYADTFPVSTTSTITTDVGKSFQRHTQLDADGHVLSVTEGISTLFSWSRKAKTRYDAFGRAVESYLPEFVAGMYGGISPSTGPKDVTTYDGFDRATQVTNADATTTSSSYEPRDVTDTDARGVTTVRSYDAFGELVTVSRAPAYAEASSHSFVRDGRGEIVKVTDGDGSVRRIERDGGGRIRFVTLPIQPGATPSRFAMCHDLDDKLVRLESPAGRVVTVLHDELGRTLQTTATDANGLTVTTSQTYDQGVTGGLGLGRLTSKTDESGVYNLTYDAYGRPKTLGFAPSARAIAGATNVAASYGATFVYTPAGALTTVSITGLPKATSLTYVRDQRGRINQITTKEGTAVTTLAADFLFEADDKIKRARYGNGTSAEWTFNALNERLDRIAYLDSAGAELAAVAYWYDADGNPTREDREKGGGVYSQKFHAYDPLNRLASSEAFLPGGGSQYESNAFSPSGNINAQGTNLYSYGSPVTSQAVTHVTDIWGDKQRNLAYDADGYLATDQHTSADGSSSTRTVAFDPTGCMRSITREDLSSTGTSTSAASEYTCGLDGKVVARDTTKIDGSRSRRIDFAGLGELRPDEGIFMMRVPVSGSVSVEDARSLATGSRVTSMSGYLVNDARGSVLATTGFTTGAASFTTEAEYDAWGKKLEGYSILASPRHGFVGAEPDDAVGTYSFGARTYDPTLGRWVSPDPLLVAQPSIDEESGAALNLYGYADGNPVKHTDTTGYCPQCLPIAAGIVGGAVVIIGMGASAPSDTKQAPANVWGMVASVGGPPVVTNALLKTALAVGEKFAPKLAGGIRVWVNAASKAEAVPAKAAPAVPAAETAAVKATAPAAAKPDNVPHATFKPGPHAGESIPARSPAQTFTAGERSQINKIGSNTGCHTCGKQAAGTKSGNFVPDHQPVSSITPPGTPQRLYPHCIGCSREQGLAAARLKQSQGQGK